MDLDLCLGDADVFLDTIPEYTLSDVAQNINRLDLTLLKRSLTKHDTGLYLLPRPVQLEDARHITTDELTRVLGLLKASFTHVIIDTSKGFTRHRHARAGRGRSGAARHAARFACLRNVVRLMMSFKESGKFDDQVKIVVNRVGYDTGQISLKKAQETIGREIFWQVPNDYRVMVEVRNNGVPLVQQAPKAAITQSINQLAVALSGKTDDGRRRSRRQKAAAGATSGPPARNVAALPGSACSMSRQLRARCRHVIPTVLSTGSSAAVTVRYDSATTGIDRYDRIRPALRVTRAAASALPRQAIFSCEHFADSRRQSSPRDRTDHIHVRLRNYIDDETCQCPSRLVAEG